MIVVSRLTLLKHNKIAHRQHWQKYGSRLPVTVLNSIMQQMGRTLVLNLEEASFPVVAINYWYCYGRGSLLASAQA